MSDNYEISMITFYKKDGTEVKVNSNSVETAKKLGWKQQQDKKHTKTRGRK